MQKVIILGAGGHAKVVADIIRKNGDFVEGFLDDSKEANADFFGGKILGKISEYEKYKNCRFIIAIGSNAVREKLSELKVEFYTAVHPGAVIGEGVKLGRGTVVMAGAVINADAVIGEHCIINTGAVVEHDNLLADFVHISPTATLCGSVKVGKRTQIGCGAKVRNNLSITDDVLVGVGAAVVKDITESGVYAGVPAKKIK